MRKLSAFNFLTLNGFYKGLHEDTSWHVHGEEGNRYSEEQMKSGNILMFGRKTYEMMSSFWPTPMAVELFPDVAEGMNRMEKMVWSNTLKKATWNNTRIMSGDLVKQIKALKKTEGSNITILGSGSIITQLTDAGLIDEYTFMIDPVAIGKGTPVFDQLKGKLELRLKDTRVFKNSGAVLLTYARAGRSRKPEGI